MDEPKTEIGRRIQRVAKRLGKEVTQMCENTSVSHTTVYRWMSGETKKPGGAAVREFARANGISPEWLLKGEGEMLIANARNDGQNKTITHVLKLPGGEPLFTVTINLEIKAHDVEMHDAAYESTMEEGTFSSDAAAQEARKSRDAEWQEIQGMRRDLEALRKEIQSSMKGEPKAEPPEAES